MTRDETPKRCRYCAEDADFLIEGWRYGAPDNRDRLNGSARPDMQIAACGIHRTTALLKVTSSGAQATTVDLNDWSAPGFGGRGSGDGTT